MNHSAEKERRARGTRGTGIVLCSGGARGAYQAGALSVLLPELARRGESPTIIAGASAGAINALYLASVAHLPPEAQGEALLQRWRQLREKDVLLPVWFQVPRIALSWLCEVLGLPFLRLRGLMGIERFGDTLQRLSDFPQIHENVLEGRVDAIALMATAVVSGRNVAFLESRRAPPTDDGRLEWVPTELGRAHVMASSAVPILMPPANVESPEHARGWYLDGSVSLRTPLRPALDLGATRLAVVGCTPLAATKKIAEGESGEPDLADAIMCVLDALVDDTLLADLAWLGERNERAARSAAPEERGIPHLVVTPDDQTDIGALALDVLKQNYRGLRGLRRPAFPLMHALLGRKSPLQGELMSFALFDGDFIDELLELGARDARRRLQADSADGPWRTGAVRRAQEELAS